MDAGMAAISSMKRESARRSRPPPATGASSFQFPRPAGGAIPLPLAASPRTRHFSQGPDETANSSIAARMLAEDEESALPYAQPMISAPPRSAQNPTEIPLPLSPPPPISPPSIPRYNLTDQPLPPLPESPCESGSVELARPPTFVHRVPPRAFTPPTSSTDFHVIPHQRYSAAYEEPQGGMQGPPPPRSRFAEASYPSAEDLENEKWDGGFDVSSQTLYQAEEDKKRRKKKVWWGLVVIVLVVIGGAVGAGVGISRSGQSSSALDNAASLSSTSSSATRSSRATQEAVATSGTSTAGLTSSSSSSSAEPTVEATSSSLLETSSSILEIIASSSSILSTPTLSSSARFRSTSSAVGTSTNPALPTPTSSSTTPDTSSSSPATPTRTRTRPIPSITCVVGGVTVPVLGVVGAETITLEAGESCPTGIATGSRSSSSGRGDEDEVAEDEDDEEEEDARPSRGIVLRHKRMRRGQGSYRL